MSILILNCEKTREAIGNSLTLNYTRPKPTVDLQILGETVGKKAVFGTATVTITGMASLPFTAGASLTFSGFATTANNKTVTLSSISGLVMTFPAGSFAAACELQGTISDGTNTVNIAVSPTNPQVLTSLLNFDYLLNGKNLFNKGATPTLTSADVTIAATSTGVTVSNTSLGSRYKGFIVKVKPGVTYRMKSVSARTGASGGGIVVFVYNGSLGSTLGGASSTLNPDFSFVAPSTGQVAILFYSDVSTTASASATFSNVQLEVGSTATPYEPYTGITVTVPLKDTSNNQLTLAGRALTYNANGTPATWYGRDQVIKKTDGKWYHRKNGAFEANATERADFWNLTTPVDTELSAADQTALNSVAKTFAGTTNIMLSDSKGQIYLKYKARR